MNSIDAFNVNEKGAEQSIETLYEKIDAVFDGLTPAQQKATIYIRKNWEQICIMTAKEVGNKSGVSEATIQRISICLGYRGFMDMKKKMKNNLLKNRAVVKFELKSSYNETSWLDEHVNSEVTNIIQTFTLNSDETFEIGATTIVQAKRIWVLGEKMGLGASSYLSFILNYLLGRGTHLNQSNCFEHLSFMNENDVLIVIGFQRYSKSTLKIVGIAKEKGVKVVTFTDCDLSPFAKLADVSFYAQTSSITFLDSYSSVLSLAQALIAKIVELDRQEIRHNIENTEKIYNSL